MAIVAGVVALALVLTGTVSLGGRRFEGPGWATPQAAVEAYLQALKAEDVDGMVAAFAVETYVEHFDLHAFIKRLNAYQSTYSITLPSGGVMTDINSYRRLASVTQEIEFQFTTLSDPDWEALTPIPAQAYGDADALYQHVAQTLDGTAFAGVTSWDFITPDEVQAGVGEIYNSADNQRNRDTMLAVYGADELTDMALSVETAGGRYFLIVQAVRYGDRWWINTFNGNLSNVMSIPSTAAGLLRA